MNEISFDMTFRDNNARDGIARVRLSKWADDSTMLQIASMFNSMSNANLVRIAQRQTITLSTATGTGDVKQLVLYVLRSVAPPEERWSFIVPGVPQDLASLADDVVRSADMPASLAASAESIAAVVTGKEMEYWIGGLWR